MTDWWKQNEVPPCPSEAERAKLSDRIREWRPDYSIGDKVRHRGPLGGHAVGEVRSFDWFGTHLMAVVEYATRTEEFAASEYVKAW